jgi:hypothetical protein
MRLQPMSPLSIISSSTVDNLPRRPNAFLNELPSYRASRTGNGLMT